MILLFGKVKDQALEKPLTELIRLLTGDYDDDLSKVRALYRWFTSQPVETTDYKKNSKSNTAMFQLWNLKQKRNTYAGFFSLLCWYVKQFIWKIDLPWTRLLFHNLTYRHILTVYCKNYFSSRKSVTRRLCLEFI